MTTIEKYNGGSGVEAAEEWDRERIELVKRTYCKGATDDELALFIATAKRTGLSPEARQIFAIKRWDNAERREVMATQTSIDGLRLIAERSGKWAGTDDPMWCGPDGAWVDVWLKKEPPTAAKVAVRRHDWQVPRSAVALWSEYAQTKKDGSYTAMWARMPALMLAKCAEALALRAAFPAELSGLYTNDEMGQAESEPVAAPSRPSLPRPVVDVETGEILADAVTTPNFGGPPPKVATKRPPPGAKKDTAILKEAISDPTVSLLVADLNAIEDPEARKEAKSEFVARFGKPEELKPEQYEEASAFVASVTF